MGFDYSTEPEWIATYAGLLLVVTGIAILIVRIAFFLRAERFEGEIVGSEQSSQTTRDGGSVHVSTSFYPLVRYRTDPDGEDKFVEAKVGTSGHAAPRPGTRVRVLRDRRTGQAKIGSFAEMWVLPLFFCFIGGCISIISGSWIALQALEPPRQAAPAAATVDGTGGAGEDTAGVDAPAADTPDAAPGK